MFFLEQIIYLAFLKRVFSVKAVRLSFPLQEAFVTKAPEVVRETRLAWDCVSHQRLCYNLVIWFRVLVLLIKVFQVQFVTVYCVYCFLHVSAHSPLPSALPSISITIALCVLFVSNQVILHLQPVLCVPPGYDPYLTVIRMERCFGFFFR